MTAAFKLQQEARQEGIQEGIREGIREGMYSKTIDMAKYMVIKGFDLNSIQELTGLSKEEIERLK